MAKPVVLTDQTTDSILNFLEDRGFIQLRNTETPVFIWTVTFSSMFTELQELGSIPACVNAADVWRMFLRSAGTRKVIIDYGGGMTSLPISSDDALENGKWISPLVTSPYARWLVNESLSTNSNLVPPSRAALDVLASDLSFIRDLACRFSTRLHSSIAVCSDSTGVKLVADLVRVVEQRLEAHHGGFGPYTLSERDQAVGVLQQLKAVLTTAKPYLEPLPEKETEKDWHWAAEMAVRAFRTAMSSTNGGLPAVSHGGPVATFASLFMRKVLVGALSDTAIKKATPGAIVPHCRRLALKGTNAG